MTNEQDREQEARVVAQIAATLFIAGLSTGNLILGYVTVAREILAESRKQVQEGK